MRYLKSILSSCALVRCDRFFICVLGGVSFVSLFISFKLYKKIERLENTFVEYRDVSPSAKNVASLYHAYAIRDSIVGIRDGREHHVICLGNSITRHGRKDSIGWKSDWGMAASRKENDYCHVLEKKLREYNRRTTVVPMNIADWERNLTMDIDSLLKDDIRGCDVAIIRLGENVQDRKEFRSAIIRLTEYCKKKCGTVYLTGCFWQDDDKESSIINAAQQCNVRYVPLFWLPVLYRNDIYPKEGDTLRDVKNRIYRIQGNFIVAHPNDEGMRRIADTIFDNL